MAEHVWTVLCRRGTIDTDSNILTLIEVIERIIYFSRKSALPSQAEEAVYTRVQAEVISYWVRSNPERSESATVRLQHLAPDGSILTDMEFPVDLVEKRGQRLKLRFEAFPINRGEGIHHVVLQLKRGKKWIRVARIPVILEIVLTDDSASESEAPGNTAS